MFSFLVGEGIVNGIKVIRTRLGIRQKQLARAVGVTANTIWRIETGRNQPSWKLATKIANYLGCTLDELNIQK